MKIKKILLNILFLLLAFSGMSQVKVTGYSIYAIGVSVPINEKFGAELKTYPNRSIENVDFEITGFYNFKPGDFHQFHVGVGLGLNPYNADEYFSIPVALEFKPLQTFKRFSCVFELAPEINFEDSVNLRYLWGISYSFNTK